MTQNPDGTEEYQVIIGYKKADDGEQQAITMQEYVDKQTAIAENAKAELENALQAKAGSDWDFCQETLGRVRKISEICRRFRKNKTRRPLKACRTAFFHISTPPIDIAPKVKAIASMRKLHTPLPLLPNKN